MIPKSPFVTRSIRIVSAIAVLMFALSILAVAMPKTVSAAEPDSIWVVGFVQDSVGNYIEGASVVVEDVTAGITYDPVLSDADAQYYCQIPASDWTSGDEIHVVATYGSLEGFNDGFLPEWEESPGFLRLDISMSDAIPEFGTTLGASIAACLVGAVAIVAVGVPKKKTPQ